MTLELRPATADDADAIVEVFHSGWHEAHAGHVPDGLTQRRTRESFVDRVGRRLAETNETTVATIEGRLAGFVMVHDDEVEQLYVDRRFRGTGVAGALLEAAAQQVARAGHSAAFLAVARGNSRARAFYARQGWADEGDLDYRVTALGRDFVVPCRRLTRSVSVG